MSNSLPQGWSSCTLADIAAVNPKTVADESLIAGFVPMSHAPTSYHGELLFDEKPWGEIKKSYTNFQDGDVIFAKVTPCFENGKAAIVDDLPNGIGAGSSEFYVLRPHCSGISQKLLFALIKTHAFMQEGATNMTGAVGLRRVPKSFVETFPIVLPPAEEQKEITDRLDTLLAQVEATQAHLARIPDIIKRFRQSVLSVAVSGKLTDSWQSKNYSYYRQLDTEILESPKLKKYLPLNSDEINNAKVLLGCTGLTKWKLYPLEVLIDPERGISYGIVQTGEPDSDGIPTIRCGDVKHFQVNKSQLKRVSTKIEAKYSRTRLIGNEVILAIRGSVGNAAVITKKMAESPINISREIAMIPVRKNINPHFIALLLQSPGGYRCLAEKTKGVAQKGINIADVKRLVTPLPPLDEQTEIVRRVEQLFAYADSIEQQAKAAKERVDKLTQAILAKAFRGELTADWRAANPELISGDNSAAALLARIQAERAAAKPHKSRRV